MRNRSLFVQSGAFVANHWNVTSVSGKFAAGDDTAHAQKMDSGFDGGYNAGSIGGIGTTALHNGMRVEGSITDPTGAVIPGARVQATGTTVTSDATGHYVLACEVTAKLDGVGSERLDRIIGEPPCSSRIFVWHATVNIEIAIGRLQVVFVLILVSLEITSVDVRS